MTRLALCVAFVVAVSGCAPVTYEHVKQCAPAQDGYQACTHTHVVDYRMDHACTGSCP